MKTIKYILFLTGLAAFLGGCNPFVEDYEVSPNDPENVTPEVLLSSAEAYTFNNYHGNAARIVSVFTEQMGARNFPYTDYGDYLVDGSDIDNTWSTSLYAGALKDCRELTRLGEAQNKPWYAGVGRILTAMNLGMATSCWGDVPYSDALSGKDNLTPAFDAQQTVYDSIQAMLDQAIDELTPLTIPDTQEGGVLIPPAEAALLARHDYMFGRQIEIGDWAYNWLGTAWALKARYYNHLSQVDPQGSAQAALDAIENFDALFPEGFPYAGAFARFGTGATQSNFWRQFEEQTGLVSPGAFLIDTMNSLNDPRIHVYAFTERDEYVGVPPGMLPGEVPDSVLCLLGDIYYLGTDLPLITETEVRFIQAECQLRAGNAGEAMNNYLLGIELSLIETNAGGFEYIDEQIPDVLTLDHIMLQKYLALYLQIEVWTDYRRTGLPQIYLNPFFPEFFPLSLPTAQAEAQRNPNATDNPDGSLPVWWDVD